MSLVHCFMSQPNPEWASRIGKNEGLWRYTIQLWQELHVLRPVTESVKLTTSFRIRSDERRKAHGQVVQGKKMSIYTDPLLCKKASLIYRHSPRYCHQNCEIPVRGKEYLEGYRGRQWGKHNIPFFEGQEGWEKLRPWMSKHIICITTSQFHAHGWHY